VLVATATDRRAALETADLVVNAVRIGGLAARSFDETFPHQHGIPGEETMGPGGFANAARTVPALRATWEEVATVAPGALTINLTNPSGIVVAAAEREFDLAIVSLCDSPAVHCEGVAARLGLSAPDVAARYLGMNHVGWWVPGTADELATTADLAMGQEPEAVMAQGAVGAPYVRYYLHPDRILAAQQAAAETRAQQLLRLEATLLAGYAAGASELPRRGAVWYSKAVVPFIDAWLHGRQQPLIVGLRNAGRIPGLPDSVMTEGPVVFPSPGELAGRPSPELPPVPASLLAQHAAFETLAVEAILAGGPRRLVERALLANPMVRTWDQAAGLADAILSGSLS
jgi:6-phospho-beta-glucosidase